MQPQDFFKDDTATYANAKTRQPSDFVFSMWNDPAVPEGITTFVITPRAYWLSTNKTLDVKVFPFLAHLLPPGCSEPSASFFITKTPRDQFLEEMTSRGFEVHPPFETYLHTPRSA